MRWRRPLTRAVALRWGLSAVLVIVVVAVGLFAPGGRHRR